MIVKNRKSPSLPFGGVGGGRILLVLALIACIMASSCSSDDDDAPVIQKFEMGTTARPNWQMPNFDNYEQTMTVMILLQDTLCEYASQDDILCAQIGNEVRGLASLEQYKDRWVASITVGSNEAGQMVTLSYYCTNLRRIFTTEWTSFDANLKPTGEGSVYQPLFVKS